METEKTHFIVKTRNQTYNVENFLENHPGGINYLENYQNKDITTKMTKDYHSKSALYLLEEYNIKGRQKNVNNVVEDLEDLVDWNKPLLYQVGNLGKNYNEWVNLPVDRHLRLFESDILEYITITPWYIVPVIWIPVSLIFLYRGIFILKAHSEVFSILTVLLGIALGILVWTLLEYSLHRWIFHLEPSGKSKFGISFHFVLHGLHHKVPFDTRRLVFPPVPAAVIVYIIYHIYKNIFPTFIMEIVAAGSVIGYVIYDMTHFYLHAGSPKDGSYLYFLKRYHNQHHFVYHDKGFGISNDLWDNIFGTVISLKKLAISIRWSKNSSKN